MAQIGEPRRIITVEPVFSPVPQREKYVEDAPQTIPQDPERVDEPVPARS